MKSIIIFNLYYKSVEVYNENKKKLSAKTGYHIYLILHLTKTSLDVNTM